MGGKIIERLPWLDALRGFAILGVILAHMDLNNMPWFIQAIAFEGARGVQLFFILSGFSVFLSLKYLHPQEGIREFFTRRFFRIAPLFYLVAVFYLVRDSSDISIVNTITTVLFINGINPYWINSIVLGGWIITVEMMFYLLVPLFYLRIKNIKTTLYAIIIVTILNCVLAIILVSHPLISAVVSKFLILHTQCSKEVKQILLNSMILAQKGYLLLVNYVGIGFSL